MAPSDWALATALMATFPEPETTTRCPSKDFPRVFSISWVKITVPKPVASGRTSDPPQEMPLPVRTPDS
ncbi:hypothetical protein D9M72_471040 [compost metagenome]